MRSLEYSNWNSFFKTASLSSSQDKGLQFELLTVHVLKSHPTYVSKVEKVWLLRDGVPSDLRNKLNIPPTDEGIDIIAQTYAGEYWAIQCKFKSSKEPPRMKELGTFNNLAHSVCKNISLAILFHTGEKGVKKRHLMSENYQEVGLDFWLSLNSDHWKNINLISKSKKIKPTVRKPRDHQKKAIKYAQDHFLKNDNSRGRLIMPCGTGKSLTAFWIANALKANSIIVAVPSLNLIKQSLEDWTAEFVAQNEFPKPDWEIICSDESTGKLDDEFVSDSYSFGVDTTTNAVKIEEFLKRKTKGRKIIFTTYQSSDKLAQAARKAKFSFDLAILDEAHKTVGIKSKAFATLLSDANISIKKRMFMTATERVLKGTNDDVLSMDDESIYGKRFYQLTFKDAIHSSPQIISDYKILTIAVTNTQIQEIIQKNKLLSDKKNKLEEQDAQSLAAAIALRQATKKYGIKHAISFHRSIKAAESFTNLNVRLNSSKVDKINLSSYHISSKKSAGQRSQLLDDFKAEKLALMTNARCLTEGVNVPTIDCVLFADPKQSIVDIVQASGRALRVSPGKKYGYIMMPLIVPDNMELEEFTETTPFKQVSRIVAALSTQDERIVEEFRLNDQGKRTSDRRVEISGSIPVGLKLDISSFASSIEAKYWEKVGRANWRSFEEARKFVHLLNFQNVNQWREYNMLNRNSYDIPAKPDRIYSGKGWISYGDWLGNGKIANADKIFLPFEDAKKLVHLLNLKNQTDWKAFTKSNRFPENLPVAPDQIYQNNGWISFGDWLGTNYVASQEREYRDFEKARKFVRSLKLKSFSNWQEYCKSGKKPDDIPAAVHRVYKNKGWKGINDWLGTGIDPRYVDFLTFNDARSYIHKLNLKNIAEWRAFCKSGKLPTNIPRDPERRYIDAGWKGYGDWLGTGTVASFLMKYREFSKARKFVRSLKLKNVKEWQSFCKSKEKPIDIPVAAHNIYKDKGWISYGDWLGNVNISNWDKNYVTFKEARKYVCKQNIESVAKWKIFSKSLKRPKNIPVAPDQVYKNSGWEGWADFLGKA
jgi:superfamily II DNA or RNA helicase